MLSVKQIREIIRRGRADFADCHKKMKRWNEFYCNKSWDPDDKNKLEARGQKAVEVNITAPAVDLIVGMMSSVMIDYDAKPQIPAGKPVGKESTWALKHASIVNHLDMFRRLVTEDSVKHGVGYMLSGPYVRVQDPSEEIFQYNRIPPDWVWYDLDDPDPLLRQARFIGISRWIPISNLIKNYPKFTNQLKSLRGMDDSVIASHDVYKVPFASGDTIAIPPLDRWGDAEWNLADKHHELDRRKDQVLVHEVYYRDYEKAHFYVDQSGQPKRFDPQKNIARVMQPDVQRIFTAQAPVIRCAVMAGPYRLDDRLLPVRAYPIVPYFWKRDAKGLPFGFIAQIEHQQQELNARRARALWSANAQQIQLDGDSFFENHTQADYERLQEEAAKPNGIIPFGMEYVNPWAGAQNGAAEQLPWLSRADAEVRMAAGITENLAGDATGKSPKSAEAGRQQTLQAGMTFEARRAGFIEAHRHLGQVSLEWLVKLHSSPFWIMVSDLRTGQDVMQQIKLEDIPHLITVTVGPFTPTMLEKQTETLRLLLPMLPQDPKLQVEGTLFLLSTMNMPGIGMLQDAMKDYLQRVQTGQTPPEPMQEPAHRPRQKRRSHHAASPATH